MFLDVGNGIFRDKPIFNGIDDTIYTSKIDQSPRQRTPREDAWVVSV